MRLHELRCRETPQLTETLAIVRCARVAILPPLDRCRCVSRGSSSATRLSSVRALQDLVDVGCIFIPRTLHRGDARGLLQQHFVIPITLGTGPGVLSPPEDVRGSSTSYHRAVDAVRGFSSHRIFIFGFRSRCIMHVLVRVLRKDSEAVTRGRARRSRAARLGIVLRPPAPLPLRDLPVAPVRLQHLDARTCHVWLVAQCRMSHHQLLRAVVRVPTRVRCTSR